MIPSGFIPFFTASAGAFGVAAVQLVGVYGLALLRMWSLMGARKDSLFAWLSVLNDLDDNG